jgi:hypothetical protein
MEALYSKHYGSVIRFNSKALLDSKQYEAKLKGIAASSQKNNNKK